MTILYRRDPRFYGWFQQLTVTDEVADWQAERFAGRQALLDYAEEKGIPVTSTKAKPWYALPDPSRRPGLIV